MKKRTPIYCKLVISCLLFFIVFSLTLQISAQEKELNVWIPSPGERQGEIIDEIINKFESQYPDVKVNVTGTPFNEHFKKLGLAISSGRGPDVYKVTEIWTYVEMGYALPMSEQMAEEERASLYPNWIDEASYQGEMYAGLAQSGPRMLVYNKEMFKEAGLERPPETWDELVEYAKKLTIYNGDRIQRAGLNLTQGAHAAYSCAFPGFLLANGGQWVDETNKNPMHNNQPGVEALQLWIDLIHEHKVGSLDFSDESFILEQSAMRFEGPWILDTVKSLNPALEEKVGLALIPPPTTDDEPVLQDSPWKWMVNSETDLPEASWQFVNFYVHEWAENYAAQYPSPIFYKDIAEKHIERFEEEGNDQIVSILKTAAVSRRRPKYWRTFAVRTGTWIEKALLGQVSAKEALDKAAEEIKKAIEEGGEL